MTWAERLRAAQWYWVYAFIAGPSLIRLIAFPDAGWDLLWLAVSAVLAVWAGMWALMQLLSVPLRLGQRHLRHRSPAATVITITELRSRPVDSPSSDIVPINGPWKGRMPKTAVLQRDRLEFWSGESTPRELFTIRRGEIVDVRSRRYVNGISRVTAIEVIAQDEEGLSNISFVPTHPIGRPMNARRIAPLYEQIATWWRQEATHFA